MSASFWVPAGTDSNETNIGMPGAAPLGSLMQGNPNPPNGIAPQAQPPLPQTSSAQLAVTQLSNGAIPVNVQPSNVAAVPGGTSLLALLSTGQLSMNGSNYGQGNVNPPVPPSAVPLGPASGITEPSAIAYLGN